MQGHPALHAIQAAFVNVRVTDPHGRKVAFVPWFGALAHAIFFTPGSLDYFHTHVCGPERPTARACSVAPGSAATPPPRASSPWAFSSVRGTWRLFLQMRRARRVAS